MSSKPAASDEPQQVKDVQGDDRWMSLHNRFVLSTKEGEPEVVFIGDSLIQHLGQTAVWEKMCQPLHCMNFGIGADQTQNVLWRVQNGEMDCIEPRVIVLLIGTNNHEHTAEEVVKGILAIVDSIKEKQPSAEVVVMGIPPRGRKPNKLREKIAVINSKLAEEQKNSSIPNYTFFPTDPTMYVNSDGLISHLDMYDYLHLTNRGYEKLCEPLLEHIQVVLKEFVKVENTSLDSDSLAGDLATKVP